jgi:Zn-dependent peptidase ImmA (M78 family)
MTKKRQKQIEEAALALLRQAGRYPASYLDLVEGVGIDVQAVATYLGIEVVLHDFGDEISGVLLRDGDKAKIGYAERTGFKRRRFTIAHELGHYLLNHQRQGVFIDTTEKYFTLFRDSNSSTGEDFQEREANAFAASLLMPRALLLEGMAIINQLEESREEEFDLVKGLAIRFNVSKLAMSYRLTNLDSVW